MLIFVFMILMIIIVTMAIAVIAASAMIVVAYPHGGRGLYHDRCDLHTQDLAIQADVDEIIVREGDQVGVQPIKSRCLGA